MKNSYRTDDLIVALATPRGRGALAVIRTSGPGCIDAFAGVFSRPDRLAGSPGNRVHHGWLMNGSLKIDEILATVFRAPVSYTGQDSVELSCHGGPAVVDCIMDVLRSAGFRDAAPGEFTFRAFSAGKMDLTRAEAVREIIDARTDRARALAASRLSGSIESVIDAAKEAVKLQAAVAALALDYPEDEAEEVPFDFASVAAAAETIRSLLATWRTGRLYRDGLKVALAGPTNAGKSSLFNLFLREERSIVTEVPGTTRDWVEAWLNLDGIPLLLADTAGLRDDAGDAIEEEGIRRTRSLIAGSDLVIAVADGTLGAAAAVRLEAEEINALGIDGEDGESEGGGFGDQPADRLVRVWNKADLASDAPEGWIPVSAATGEGFSELEETIRSRAFHGGGAPEADAPVIDSERQRNLLQRAAAAMDRFLEGGTVESRPQAGPVPVDLLAEDLRDALDALGELTGEVSRADVLETLFGEFCVGK